jgi:hypothetical protein
MKMRDRDKMIERVRKLLELANTDKNPSLEEAQNAMLKAQQYMAEYSIAKGDIAEPMRVDAKPIEGFTPVAEILWWKKQLGDIVADNFRCYFYYRPNRGVCFLGMEEDVELAQVVFAFAISSIIYLSKRYIHETVQKGQRAYAVPKKNSYINGFLQGLRDRFAEQVESDSMALVVVKSDALIKAHDAMTFKTGKASKKVDGGDILARMAGYEDGKAFDHTKKMVEG